MSNKIELGEQYNWNVSNKIEFYGFSHVFINIALIFQEIVT